MAEAYFDASGSDLEQVTVGTSCQQYHEDPVTRAAESARESGDDHWP